MAEKTDIASSEVQGIIDVFNHDKTLAPRCRRVGELLQDRMTEISRFYWSYWTEMGNSKIPKILK
jgi:Ni,Fe-hydrogenase III large subunit